MAENPFLTIDREILADSGTCGELSRNLFHLCDQIGARFAGTSAYRRAADFMLAKFQEYGLRKAHLEPFEFKAWKRGETAACRILSPAERSFDCYALPYGASTGETGLTGEIVDIGGGGRADVEGKSGQIKERFVLTTAKGRHRQETYWHCVEKGAAGFILASTAPGGLLGTGTIAEGEGGPIPAVNISHESSQWIIRQLERSAVRVKLDVECGIEPAVTWNVVGELVGREFPDELVIIGGHLDSHDIGPGAFDNGAGSMMVLETARLLARQHRHLKRTIRFIGFAGEEVGLLGSHYHARTHAEQLQKARFMLNCDTPALGQPRGLAFHECPKGADYMQMLSLQMETPLVCQNRAHCHSDHYPFVLQGVATAGVGGGPFGPAVQHFAHMAGDTPDKVSVTDLRDCAAFAARILLRAANDEQWPDMRRTPEQIKEFGK